MADIFYTIFALIVSALAAYGGYRLMCDLLGIDDRRKCSKDGETDARLKESPESETKDNGDRENKNE